MQAFSKRSSRVGMVHFAGVHGISRGSRARVVHFLLGGVLEGFAGILETEGSRVGVVHFTGVRGISRGSRARVVHFLIEGVLEGFAGIFETELPCGSGALRGSSRDFPGLPCESGALFVRGCFGRVCRHFRNRAPVWEWCTSRDFAGFPGAPEALLYPGSPTPPWVRPTPGLLFGLLFLLGDLMTHTICMSCS